MLDTGKECPEKKKNGWLPRYYIPEMLGLDGEDDCDFGADGDSSW